MFEKLTRPLVATCLLLLGSIAILNVPFFGFTYGLDLEGGTRLVYRFDFDQAIEDGLISADENRAELLQQQVAILRNRVDTTGTLEPNLHTQGTNNIVIELPGNVGSDPVVVALDAPVQASDGTITLDPLSDLGDLPQHDGVIRIQDEQIAYGVRNENLLLDCRRGFKGTEASDHPETSTAMLTSGDKIRSRIENLGELSFLIVAEYGMVEGLNPTDERQKLSDWLAANPGRRISEFNSVEGEAGKHEAIRWFPVRPSDENEAEAFDPSSSTWAQACLIEHPEHPEWVFRGDALKNVYFTSDRMGKPAVGFEMKSGAPRENFADFTEHFEDSQMAIVLNKEIVSAPVLNGRLSGASIIQGRFEISEVRDLITVLRTGSLRLQPVLQNESRVGPTLGASYVRRGLMGGALALTAVLAFMLLYYRRLGIYSSISLLCTMLMVMGGLAFLQATLTLPGIAGLILTVGMAVDANILIFDRVREERDKGRNVKQAAKNGFHNAMSAILDANITTFLTGMILYNVGTGPIRGFAVTLMIGILTSVFAALIITRLLVHLALARGAREFSMGAWMADAKYAFLDKARFAIPASLLVISAGITGFVLTPNDKKLGIEFLGGRSALIRTEEPSSVDEISNRLQPLEEELGRTIQVKSVLEYSEGEGHTGFRLTYKQEGAEGAGDASEDTDFRSALESTLGNLLRKGPVDVEVGPGGDASLQLYFEDSHPEADLAARLAGVGVADPQVTAAAGEGIYEATGKVGTDTDSLALRAAVEKAFSQDQVDSKNVSYALTNPIPDLSTIGKQVVGELRDKAILSIIISLFVIVLYIRVRFAEYSYGFAAVAALLHDVLVTLTIMTLLMNLTGLAVEMSLPMIAAFLTIIGYSLNDTIVVFDRVRENLPRHKGSLKEVLDLSINQTLSRTIMTSLTTLIAASLIFAFNVGSGNVLEGFAIAMICGVLVGTYSSIFVACPVFCFLEGRTLAARAASGEETSPVALAESKRSEAVV